MKPSKGIVPRALMNKKYIRQMVRLFPVHMRTSEAISNASTIVWVGVSKTEWRKRVQKK